MDKTKIMDERKDYKQFKRLFKFVVQYKGHVLWADDKEDLKAKMDAVDQGKTGNFFQLSEFDLKDNKGNSEAERRLIYELQHWMQKEKDKGEDEPPSSKSQPG